MDLNLELLERIGLTKGEIRVYEALILLGKSSTGNIMKKSEISSSKVYLILDKLIQKGLVSFVLENKVKYFQITNPKTIENYIDKKKEELDETKDGLSGLIEEIPFSMGSIKEGSAQIYVGLKGLKAAYNNILDELNSGEEYYFFGVSKIEVEDRDTYLFFKSVHEARVEKGVYVKGIVDSSLKEFYDENDLFKKYYSFKNHPLTMPTGVIIGKNRILILLFGVENIAYELVSERIAEKYKKYFEKLWDESEE